MYVKFLRIYKWNMTVQMMYAIGQVVTWLSGLLGKFLKNQHDNTYWSIVNSNMTNVFRKIWCFLMLRDKYYLPLGNCIWGTILISKLQGKWVSRLPNWVNSSYFYWILYPTRESLPPQKEKWTQNSPNYKGERVEQKSKT